METFGLYTLKAALVLALFLAIYRFLLRGETFYRFNRFFLLGGMLLAFGLPFVSIHYPVEVAVVQSNMASYPVWVEPDAGASLYAMDDAKETALPSWRYWLLPAVYVAGLLFVLMLRMHGVARLQGIIRRNGYEKLTDCKLVCSTEIKDSFSFFRYIFLPRSMDDGRTKDIVLRHEKAHVAQKHWIDLLVGNMLCVVWWFNPLIWLYMRSVRENHEFLADNTVLKDCHRSDYQSILLNQWLKVPVFPISNSFSDSNQLKRIKMMKNTVSNPLKKGFALLAIPFLALFLWSFAEPEYVYVQQPAAEPELVSQDTTPKKKWIPYLYTDAEIDSMIEKRRREPRKYITISGVDNLYLYVVDGELLLDSLKNIPIDSIYSMSTMKEGEAYRQYGEKVRNGVILITTKKAREKLLKQAPINMSGLVTDEDNNPIKAATVAVLNTISGTRTHTDEEGQFHLQVSPVDAVNVYTDGYSMERIYISERDIHDNYIFKLKKKEEDVAVTEEEEIMKEREKEEYQKLFINKPLMIVDGEIVANESFKVPPEDIFSLSVLKDDATHLYGEKAKNGVILITTKKGHERQLAKPISNYIPAPVKQDTVLKVEIVPEYTDAQIDSMIDRGREYRRFYTNKEINDKTLIVVDDELFLIGTESLRLVGDLFSLSIMPERDAYRRYGEKARNGVVLITSKKGREKQLEQAPINISGLVTDENNNPIKAATVAVTNTITGTYTDDNGRFHLQVSHADVISAYAHGYSMERLFIKAEDNHNNYKFKLKKAKE